ncbi:MAG: hypothetical protein ACJ74U_01400 [Jatrophihabitantaceae bacterium]
MYNQLCLDSQRRVIDLFGPLTAGERTRPTPACPEWAAADLLTQLAGNSAVQPARHTDLIGFG